MCQNLIYLSNVVQYGKMSDAEVKVIMQVTDVTFKMTQSKKKNVWTQNRIVRKWNKTREKVCERYQSEFVKDGAHPTQTKHESRIGWRSLASCKYICFVIFRAKISSHPLIFIPKRVQSRQAAFISELSLYRLYRIFFFSCLAFSCSCLLLCQKKQAEQKA